MHPQDAADRSVAVPAPGMPSFFPSRPRRPAGGSPAAAARHPSTKENRT